MLLTGAQAADIVMADALIGAIQPFASLLADEGYDADRLRRWLAESDTQSVIPAKRNEKRRYPSTSAFTARAT
jgi:transposase